MNRIEYATLGGNRDAFEGLAAASGLTLRHVAELAEAGNLDAAIRCVEVRRKEPTRSLSGRVALVRVLGKRWPPH